MRLPLMALGLAFVLVPGRNALAWQIADPLHKDCHERLTQAALDGTGYVAPPPELVGNDASLRQHVDFDASHYDANIYALSLIIGVRNADTHGGLSFSFNNNAAASNADDDQAAHCLRTKEQDGEAGEAEAVRSCRGFIEALYWRALSSLDDQGSVSPDAKTDATVATEFQGPVSYPLSEFYYFSGRALHAVQDSFTHSFRSKDGHSIRHVFNWSEQISCALSEGRDGHGHEKVLDQCEDGDPSEPERFGWARQASTELLGALTRPGDHAARAARIAEFLETWMTYEPGCSLDNAYCDHPAYDWLKSSSKSDAKVCDGPLGCSSASREGTDTSSGWLIGAAATLALFSLRRRRRLLTGVLFATALFGWPQGARAEESESPPDDETTDATSAVSPAKPRGVGGLRLEARASLSVDNPAYAFGLAALYGFRRFDVGVFGELNPWYSIERRRMSFGSTNFGVLGHYLHPLRRDLVLRFGLGLGGSMLNADMLGVSAGNLGLYLNVRAFGLMWEVSDGVALTVDPLDLALPAPALVGWPILFTQHRFSLGLQMSL